MAWSYTKKLFGVCGNFRFAFYDLTDMKATNSLIKPEGFNRVRYIATTNTTDGTDVLLGRTLYWAGNADADSANALKDSGEVFDARIDGALCAQTTNDEQAIVTYKDADELYCWSPFKNRGGAAVDMFDQNNEAYTIYNERIAQVIAGTGDDDGTMLIMGD